MSEVNAVPLWQSAFGCKSM